LTYKIKALLDAGQSQTKIAQTIGVHKSAISRELSSNAATRGRYTKEHRPQVAQRKTRKRHWDKRKYIRFTEELKQQAAEWLRMEKLSPELIRGRWSVQGMDGVSHKTIYQWIWQGKACKDPDIADLYKQLKHGRRRRKWGNYYDSRGILTDRVGIEQRPEVVDKRIRLGDLEADFMMGKAHKSALLVITDRATLLTRLKKVDTRKADHTEVAIEQMLARVPKSLIKTLTVERHLNNRSIRKFDHL